MNIKIHSGQISKLGVVGTGTMGSSIAVAISSLGLPIKLTDKDPAALKKGLEQIEKIFAGLERKSEKSNQATDTKAGLSFNARRSLIETTNNLDDFQDLDLVIEAVNEDLHVKKSIFQALDKTCQAHTIFASNTSSFSITQLASYTHRAHKTIGMHFFNPAHLMPLVEIIPALTTDAKTISTIIDLVKRIDKLPIKVEECASFLVNRLLGRYINEAIWVLQSGLADIREIDSAACQIFMPIGPLELRDMNGLDIGLSVAKFNYDEYGERFRPAPLLELMVKNRLLGKKTNAGFFIYKDNERKPQAVNSDISNLITLANYNHAQPATALPPFEEIQLFLPMINEAFLLLQEKIVAPQLIDPALKAGLGMKRGLLEFAFEIGLDKCLEKIENLHTSYGERFRPAPLLKKYVWANKKSL